MTVGVSRRQWLRLGGSAAAATALDRRARGDTPADAVSAGMAAWSQPLQRVFRKRGLISLVSAISWRPDGKRLAVLHDSRNRVSVIGVPSGQVVATSRKGSVSAVFVSFTPDGRSVLVPAWKITDADYSQNSMVSMLDAETLKLQANISGPLPAAPPWDPNAADFMAVTPDRRLLAVSPGGTSGTLIELFSVPDLTSLGRVEGEHLGAVSFALSPSGGLLAIGSFGLVKVIDWRSGVVSGAARTYDLGTSTPATTTLTFTADSRLLLTGVDGIGDPHGGATNQQQIALANQHKVLIWGIPDLRLKAQLDRDILSSSKVVAHPALPLVAVVSGDAVYLLDARSGKILGSAVDRLYPPDAWSAEFSPDGNSLAVGFSGELSIFRPPSA